MMPDLIFPQPQPQPQLLLVLPLFRDQPGSGFPRLRGGTVGAPQSTTMVSDGGSLWRDEDVAAASHGGVAA